MLKPRSALPIFALVVAIVMTGCLESQVKQANTSCQASYVGRQKAACELGVTVASETAKKDNGQSATQKYRFASHECRRLERPLVSACIDGVNKFRAELAKLSTPDKSKTGRSLASSSR